MLMAFMVFSSSNSTLETCPQPISIPYLIVVSSAHYVDMIISSVERL
jgi:hypothetical protein